jgi:hypothetical protein
VSGAIRSLHIELALKVAVLVGLAATAIQSVIVPRGLYADGSYNLWQVLNTGSFVVIGQARTFAIVLNQLPVVSAMVLGVRNLDVLIGFYTFGVAAVPVLIWLAALLIQLRGAFFWQLTVIYSATFLTSGFVAIGEYNYAFALVALAVAVLVTRGPIGGWRAAALIFASVALVLCYEGMAFLGLPVVALVLARIFRRGWIAEGVAERHEKVVLWIALSCAALSVGVAALAIVIRTFAGGDTNLAGAMNVSFAFDANQQWREVALMALLLLLSLLIRHKVVVVVLRVALGVFALQLFTASTWAPAWLHYNTRSLSTYTYFVLLIVALFALVLENRRTDLPKRSEVGALTGAPMLALGLSASVIFAAMTFSFWSMNQGYSAWLSDLKTVVVSNQGPVDIRKTDLYSGSKSQFSWGWTNPYLSALLQEHDGQGLVISHVETLEKASPISPPSSPRFFERYHR